MVLTKPITRQILANNLNYLDWHAHLVTVLPKYEIVTIPRIAAFMAQCYYESRGLTVLQENLNYSASALNKVFPKYFARAGRDAREYARKPEKIANVIYANRMDNGGIQSGDGWRYRGRGIIQLTGKRNYSLFAAHINLSLEQTIQYIQTKEGALLSAVWYWDVNGLNRYADSREFTKLTKRINGGTHGLQRRKQLYHNFYKILHSA
jgi:putative chitinase